VVFVRVVGVEERGAHAADVVQHDERSAAARARDLEDALAGASSRSVRTCFVARSVAASCVPPAANVHTRAPVGETTSSTAELTVKSGVAVRCARSRT